MNVAVAVEALMQTIVAGLMVGTIYGLMGCGVGVIFGVMRVVNFAQGEFLMLAMYGGVFAAGLLGAVGVIGPTPAAYVSILLTAPVIFAFGAILHRALLSRVT